MSNAMAVSILHQSTDFIERFANIISKELEGNSDAHILDDLASYVLYFSNTVEYYEASNKVFQDTLDEIDSLSGPMDSNAVLKQFDEKMKKVEEEVMAQEATEKYTRFKKLFSTNDSKSDEVTTVSQILNTVDPITKLPITDPVKNEKCGHVYERGTITELIYKNPKTKCPIAGCNNAEFLKKSDLVPDIALKRRIGQSVGNSQKKAKLSQ